MNPTRIGLCGTCEGEIRLRKNDTLSKHHAPGFPSCLRRIERRPGRGVAVDVPAVAVHSVELPHPGPVLVRGARMTPAEELRTAAGKLRETAKEWLAYAPDHPRAGKWYEVGSLAEALDVLAGPALAEPLAAWLEDHENDHGAYDCTWDEADCPALKTARVINGGDA